MSTSMTYTEELVVTSCWCGIALAIPRTLYDFAHQKPHDIYCPNGHVFVYRDTFREKYEREQRRHQATRDLLAQEERSHRSTRGALTKARKRAAAGVCPCCHRSFANVARHVQTKHPDFNPEAMPDADPDH